MIKKISIDKVTNATLFKLLEYYKDVTKLVEISSVLQWDLETLMPSDASSRRGDLLSYLELRQKNIFLKKDFLKLLDEANSIDNKKLNEVEKRILNNLNKTTQKYKNLPDDFIEKSELIKSESSIAYRESKGKSDYSIFAPYLKKLVDITKEYVERINPKETKDTYDFLIGEYERGITKDKLDTVFTDLIADTKEILKKYQRKEIKKELIDGSKYFYSKESQEKICHLLIKKFGLNLGVNSTFGVSTHPFSMNVSRYDARVTTHFDLKNPLFAITSIIHEIGHGLFMTNFDENLNGTPLEYQNDILGLHESMSRSLENQIGRSKEFIEWLYEILVSHYPHLLDYSVEDFFTLVNQVKFTPIRVGADEVTYNFHIFLRYEIEKKIFNGELKVEELKEFWNFKMREHLGIMPETDSEGILQDIHWAYGAFGYFPSYSLGNIYSAEIFNSFMLDNPNYFEKVKKGDFLDYKTWLSKNLYPYGGMLNGEEAVMNITGKLPTHKPLIKYFEKKYLLS